MRHRKTVIGGCATVALLVGVLWPAIPATPAVAPLAGAVYMGDMTATNADKQAMLPPVHDRDEADAQCVAVFTGVEQLDCLHAAAAQWPLEDEPGWDCRIHGNKICGPGVEP